MGKFYDAFRIFILVLAMAVATGCEQQTDEDTGQQSSNPTDATEQASRSDKQTEAYPNAEQYPELATSIEQGHEDMDVLTPSDPVMAYAEYHTVEFGRGVASLAPDARRELTEFIASLEQDRPTYITIRMEDADTLDVTEPTPEFRKLAASRISQVSDLFEESDVNIADLKVDESGTSETPGEGRALARPESNGTGKNDQLVIVTIETETGGPEPSETIPHSPDMDTTGS